MIFMIQDRTEQGKFAAKSQSPRYVRAIRATDQVWEAFGQVAESQCITRADLLEYVVENGVLNSSQFQEFTRQEMLATIAAAVEKVLADQSVTRKGKDRGAVKRGLEALLAYLFHPSSTR